MKIRLFIFLTLFFINNSFGQTANKLLSVQNVPDNTSANNYMYTVPPPDNRTLVAKMDSLKLNFYQIRGLRDSIANKVKQLRNVGEVSFFAGSTAPLGYLLCDGSAVSRTTYSALFAKIGTTYGAGDGSTTFNVPDLRQRFPLTKSASGTGSTLGSSGGNIDHVHAVDPPSTNTATSGTTVQATALGGSASSPSHVHALDIASFNSAAANPPYLVLNAIILY